MLRYKTSKIVEIPSGCLATTYYTLVFLILAYLIWQVITVSKLTQKTSAIQSVVTIQVKGVLSTKDVPEKELNVPYPELYRRIWDAQDILFPPGGGENGGFFIMTNLQITPNQTRSVCSEKLSYAPCTSDANCTKGQIVENGHGICTGKCVPGTKANNFSKSCEIEAWCPGYYNTPLPFGGKRALLVDTQNFVLTVKNTVEYHEFGPEYRTRNINDAMPDNYLKKCFYDPEKNPFCPVFKIGYMVAQANMSYEQVAKTGGVFTITINWDCSFNWGNTIKDCKPKYSFARMDYQENATIAPGWNFWSATYRGDNERRLTHRYGLKFIIQVEGEGSKFDAITLLVYIGAGIGLLGVAPWVCDNLFSLFCSLKHLLKSSCLKVYDEEMVNDLTYVKEAKGGKESKLESLPHNGSAETCTSRL